MTNEEIAQRWVEDLPIIRRHIDIVADDKLWQGNPKKVLVATDRIQGLRKWCLKVMETIPEMKSYFVQDIEQRDDTGSAHPFLFQQHQRPQSDLDSGEDLVDLILEATVTCCGAKPSAILDWLEKQLGDDTGLGGQLSESVVASARNAISSMRPYCDECGGSDSDCDKCRLL